MKSTRPSGLGQELVGFGGLSAFSFILNVGVTVGLVELVGIPPHFAFATALVIVLASSFLLMRFVVFPSSTTSVLEQVSIYLPATIGFRSGEYLLFLFVHNYLGTAYQPALIGILLVSAASKFLVYRTLVFR